MATGPTAWRLLTNAQTASCRPKPVLHCAKEQWAVQSFDNKLSVPVAAQQALHSSWEPALHELRASDLSAVGCLSGRAWFSYVRLFYIGERDMRCDADRLSIRLQFPRDPDLTLTFFDRARRATSSLAAPGPRAYDLIDSLVLQDVCIDNVM